MKKLLSLILCLILTFTFASCDLINSFMGNNSEEVSSEEISSVEETSSETQTKPVSTVNRDYTRPEGASGTLVQYPTYPKELPRDYDYEVYVSNGVETIQLPVYNASRHKNSYHNVTDTDSYRRFCEFGFEGKVTVTVKVKGEMKNYVILPTSRGIKSSYKNGSITFTLDKPQNIAVRLNNDQNTILSIFAEELETDYPQETDPNVIYFKAGLNNVSKYCDVGFYLNQNGEFVIPLGYSVYLEPGALVTARVESETGNMGVKIYGRGAFLDSRLDRISDDSLANMLFMNTNSNFTIKDVKFLDAHCFNLTFTRARDAVIKNVKILSSEISSDGITFWGLENYMPGYNDNILIEDCYVYCNDNAFVITSANGMTVKNCVIGTRHAIIYPQGQLNDFTMDNMDVIRMGDFFRATEDMSSEGQLNPTWKITMSNIRAEDALSMNSFIAMQGQDDGRKDVYFENVSLPLATNKGIICTKTTNANFRCTNVYVNSVPLTSSSQLSGSSWGTNIVCTDKFDKTTAGVGVFGSSVVKAAHTADPVIKIGGYTVPYDQKGALEKSGYLPAEKVLEALNYTKSVGSYVKSFDGVRMLPYSFFQEVLGLSVKSDKTGVTLTGNFKGKNLIRDGGFENITQKRFNTTFSFSRDWTCFNFGELNKEMSIIKSGTASMRVSYSPGTGIRGIAQYITPVIRQCGSGTYTFEIYARIREGANVSGQIMFGLVESWYQLGAVENSVKTVNLTTQWTKYTYTVRIPNPNSDGHSRAFFFVGGIAGTQGIEFFLDDVALYFE